MNKFEVKINELATDNRVINFEDNYYYVGDDAMSLQSSSIIDINNYETLEYAAPIFVYKII